VSPIDNPYAPGAGAPPPELAGRDEVREAVHVAIMRAARGNAAQNVLLIGLRGVGKTVLLDRIREDAEAGGIHTVRVESPERRSLPALLAPQLRVALLRLSKLDQARDVARRGLAALAGFAKALKVKYGDIEVGIDVEARAGLADNGDLEQDLLALLEAVGEAAQAAKTALILFIDEIQYVPEDQLAALVAALHRVAQRKLPVLLVGAGLPQLRAKMGRAKSYSERLFTYPMVDALPDAAATDALVIPAQKVGVAYAPEAIRHILERTKGYPYFLQEWGKHAWDVAKASPITEEDVARATDLTIAKLDESFFGVRFDRLTPTERRYLRAMAELGAGPHRSGDIAEKLGRDVSALGPVRSSLITKGMVWSPAHGDTAFTVPLFDEYMRRTMPIEAPGELKGTGA
jgi:hypothetical protein